MEKDIYSKIYEEYHDKIFGYIYNKINDKYAAEDLCSDVFVKVIDKYDKFDSSKASMSTWIFTITRNTLIDYYRTRKVFAEVTEESAITEGIEEDFIKKETLEELANALEALDERERDIIVLKYYLGKTLKDISSKLNISYSYAKILHKKALEELKVSIG